LLYDVTLQD